MRSLQRSPSSSGQLIRRPESRARAPDGGGVIQATGSTTAPRGRLPGDTTQIFIGLVLGIILGYAWPEGAVSIRPLADLFLRMIKMIIAPLLFSTLVVGIAGTGDL